MSLTSFYFCLLQLFRLRAYIVGHIACIIRPIIRSKLSIGKLDEGGARGECAGLFFLLDDIANTIASIYGSLLRSSEGMFTHDDTSAPCEVAMEVDLVVSGVWVPVVTALMADPGIKTAIFSPGIANILQVRACCSFLSRPVICLIIKTSYLHSIGQLQCIKHLLIRTCKQSTQISRNRILK